MAKVYISEYSTMAMDLRGFMMPAGKEPSLVDQTVAITATSLESLAFNSDTRVVRISTDAVCSIAFGDDPVATTNSKRLAANQTEFFGVRPGQKVAVIANT